MNKKYIVFGLLGIFAIGLVAAGIINYYGSVETTINVNQPIEVNGEVQNFVTQTLSCDAGTTCDGDDIIITNNGNSQRTVIIDNNATDGEVEVSYVSEITLTEKTVVFGKEPWIIPVEANEVTVEYVIVGDEFSATVINGSDEDYSLVYYKDSSDRWETVGEGIAIGDIVGNLPNEDDGNFNENDYTGEYATIHGAKIWYVPISALLSEGELDWSMASSFFFETYLIQFNSDGEIVVYGNQVEDDGLTITPRYTLNAGLNESNQVITTTINIA